MKDNNLNLTSKYKVKIKLVLWDRLCNKGEKVTHWDTIEEACNYIQNIEAGLRMRLHNNEIHWEEGFYELATANATIIDLNPSIVNNKN